MKIIDSTFVSDQNKRDTMLYHKITSLTYSPYWYVTVCEIWRNSIMDHMRYFSFDLTKGYSQYQRTAYDTDIMIKTIMSVLKILTYKIINITARPVKLAVILAIIHYCHYFKYISETIMSIYLSSLMPEI